MPQQVRTHQTDVQQPIPGMPFESNEEVATGKVRLIAGADVQDVELAGRTVADARNLARLVFGISPTARALVDGREVGDDHVLRARQHLEFTKHAGRKGAAMPNAAADRAQHAGAATIELRADRAHYQREGAPLASASIQDLLARAAGAGDPPASWRLAPHQVRLMVDRADRHTTAVVVEMPPGPRQVRWISDNARDPVDGRVEKRRLSFPWVVLIVVFTDGELVNVQQAFFRTEPLATLDDRLHYTNLLNVARGYRQESWVCLFNLGRPLARLTWEARVRAVTDHFWQAAYTRSADVAEGNSFWAKTRGLDPRLESPAAWETATDRDPYFALEIGWPPAPSTLRDAVAHMLDLVAPWRPIERAEQLATLMQRPR